MKNLRFSGLNLSLLILLSAAIWSMPTFGMTLPAYTAEVAAYNSAKSSNDNNAQRVALEKIIAGFESNSPSAFIIRTISNKFLAPGKIKTDPSETMRNLITELRSRVSALPAPAAPAPAPAPAAPAAAGTPAAAAGTPAGTSGSTAAQELSDLLAKLPDTTGWNTSDAVKANFKKLIDDLKKHAGTAATFIAGGGLTSADVASSVEAALVAEKASAAVDKSAAVSAVEAAKDATHAAAQSAWASEKASLEAQVASLTSDVASKESERVALEAQVAGAAVAQAAAVSAKDAEISSLTEQLNQASVDVVEAISLESAKTSAIVALVNAVPDADLLKADVTILKAAVVAAIA